MKTIFKLTGWVLAFCLIPAMVTAQEVITGFNHGVTPPAKSREAVVLTLPFLDDFSHSKI